MWHRHLLRALDEQGPHRQPAPRHLLAAVHLLYALGLAAAGGVLMAFVQRDRALMPSLLPATAVLGLLSGGLLLWTASPRGPRPFLRFVRHAHFLFVTFVLSLAAAFRLQPESLGLEA